MVNKDGTISWDHEDGTINEEWAKQTGMPFQSRCRGDNVPASSLKGRKTRRKITWGAQKGMTGVYVECPKCKKKGKQSFIRVGVEGTRDSGGTHE